jgi:hypothetical protein
MLTALRAKQGHPALVLWGQNYGSDLLAWVEAPLVGVFGLHSWVFAMTDTAVIVIAAVLLRAVATRLMPPIAASVVGGALLFFPARWVFWSGREYLYYGTEILFAIASCLFIMRWSEQRRLRDALAAGISCGLAIWSFPLAVAVVVPPVVVFAWQARHQFHALAAMAGGLVLGVSPWLVFFALHPQELHNLHHDPQSAATTFKEAIVLALPQSLMEGQPVEAVGIAIYVAAIVAAMYFALRSQVALATCAVSIVLWPLGLVGSHSPVVPGTYRYAFIILPNLLILGGYLLSRIHLSLPAAVACAVLVTLVVSAHTRGFQAVNPCGGSIAETASYLESQGRTSVWGSYWVAPVLTVCSQTKVEAGVIMGKTDDVSKRMAIEAVHSTYVVETGQPLDLEINAWRLQNHAQPRRVRIGSYAVWLFPDRVEPATMHLIGAF